MTIKSFLLSCLAVAILVVYLIALSDAKSKCDGVLARGAFWYVCVKGG